MLKIAEDVFEHHDGVIDDQPDRQGQRHQRQVVEPVTAEIEHRKGADQSQRHGNAWDYRRPEAAQEGEDH